VRQEVYAWFCAGRPDTAGGMAKKGRGVKSNEGLLEITLPDKRKTVALAMLKNDKRSEGMIILIDSLRQYVCREGAVKGRAWQRGGLFELSGGGG